MRDSLYLWCPAYGLADGEQVNRARIQAGWLAASAGLALEESPLLAHCQAPGDWLAVDGRTRREDLQRGLDCQVLVAARGGYGCLMLAEDVRILEIRHPVGTLIGYSDVTILHALWWIRSWGETLYGFLAGIDAPERSRTSTAALLDGQGQVWDQDSVPAARSGHPGSASGIIHACCLRVLAGLIGTGLMPDLSGCLLALEDIDEAPYRIDRDLSQLRLSGCLRGVVGLVFASFPWTPPVGYAGPSAVAVCCSFGRQLGLPTVTGLPFGHDPDPLTLPCGRPASLEVGPHSWRLVIAERTQ